MFRRFTLLLSCICMFTILAYGSPMTFIEVIKSGVDNLTAHNYADAKSDFEKASKMAKSGDEKAMAHYYIGDLYMMQKDYSNAEFEFTKTIGLKQPITYLKTSAESEIATCFIAEQKFKKARSMLNKIIVSEDAAPVMKFQAQLRIGHTYFWNKQYSEARNEYEKLSGYAKDIHSADVIVNTMVGECYLKEANYKNARADFVKVLRTNEQTFPVETQIVVRTYQQQAQLCIAQSYFGEKIYPKAKDEYNRVLQMKDLNPEIETEAKKQLKMIEQAEAQHVKK